MNGHQYVEAEPCIYCTVLHFVKWNGDVLTRTEWVRTWKQTDVNLYNITQYNIKHKGRKLIKLFAWRKRAKTRTDIIYNNSLADLTFICPCIANIFAECNQQDATFHNLFISVRRSTCFRRFFRPSPGAQICTYSVRPILLPAASLARLATGSSTGLTNTWRCMLSFELLMMDGKTVWNMQSVLQK